MTSLVKRLSIRVYCTVYIILINATHLNKTNNLTSTAVAAGQGFPKPTNSVVGAFQLHANKNHFAVVPDFIAFEALF